MAADRGGRADDAVSLYGLLLARLGDRVDYDSLSCRLRLAKQYRLQDRYADASGQCTAIVSATDDARWRAEAYLELAKIEKRRHNYQEAADYYAQVRSERSDGRAVEYAYADEAQMDWLCGHRAQAVLMLSKFPRLYPKSRFNEWVRKTQANYQGALAGDLWQLGRRVRQWLRTRVLTLALQGDKRPGTATIGLRPVNAKQHGWNVDQNNQPG